MTMPCLAWLAFALFPSGFQVAPEVGGTPDLALLMAPGDPESLLLEVGRFWRESGQSDFPAIIAMEPGPLVLKRGLKLLPNQIPPRLSVPRLFLISNLGELAVSVQLLAFIRRCLVEGSEVWVVGHEFPTGLSELPLESGQSIELVLPEALYSRLSAFFSPDAEAKATDPGPHRP